MFKDITGQRFGRLVVVNLHTKTPDYRMYWKCQCDCGTSTSVRGDILRTGKTLSCGCLHRELVTTHGMTYSPTGQSWKSMKDRCQNQNANGYDQWGGRGINICERWHTFENFLTDMGERPDGTTIDRYPDNDGNYEPGNCRWATYKQQSNNRRKRSDMGISITANGKTQNIKSWAAELDLDPCNIYRRIERGWTPEEAVRTSKRKYQRRLQNVRSIGM